MKLSKKAGFTIIETVLVMAITGLLVIGVLVGTGSSISRQRYSDSLYSLQSYLQSQYSEVANTINDGTGVCGVTANRGQSDCVILGKVITSTRVSGNSVKLISKTVVGDIPITSSLNDTIAFIDYRIRESSAASEYFIEWGSQMMKPSPDSSSAIDFSILILRSPNNGLIKTYIDRNNSFGLNNAHNSILINASNLSNDLKICLANPEMNISSSLRRSVYINANASSQNGIEVLSEGGSGC